MKKIILISAALAVTMPLMAQDATQSERVQFARGMTSKAIMGSVKCYNTVVYLVGARGEQTMSVNMKTSNASATSS